MSQSPNNGIIRIGRKGLRRFAFGEDGSVFEVDVVTAFQQWINVDDSFRPLLPNDEGNRSISTNDMLAYHAAAVSFVESLAGPTYTSKLTTAEALDFIARLREQYDELAVFFRPRLREEQGSPDTSEEHSGLQFSHETESKEAN